MGRRENCKKISKMIHCFKKEPRNNRKIGILQYCPKDFCPGLQFEIRKTIEQEIRASLVKDLWEEWQIE